MTLTKIVVITSMLVRFTVRAASKKNGLKKVVAKVIIKSKTDGRKGCNTLALYAFALRFLVHLPLDSCTFALRFLYIYP